MENEQALWSCSIKGMDVCFRDFITDGADKNGKCWYLFFKKEGISLLKLHIDGAYSYANYKGWKL